VVIVEVDDGVDLECAINRGDITADRDAVVAGRRKQPVSVPEPCRRMGLAKLGGALLVSPVSCKSCAAGQSRNRGGGRSQ